MNEPTERVRQVRAAVKTILGAMVEARLPAERELIACELAKLTQRPGSLSELIEADLASTTERT